MDGSYWLTPFNEPGLARVPLNSTIDENKEDYIPISRASSYQVTVSVNFQFSAPRWALGSSLGFSDGNRIQTMAAQDGEQAESVF